MLINSKRSSFFGHYIFALLFAMLCLAVIVFGYYQYRSDKYADQVERVSLDLLGFLEYDGNFHIEDENISDVNKFVTNTGWLGSSRGLSYIWDLSENKMVWLLDEQLGGQTIYPPDLIEKLADLVYLNDNSDFEKQHRFSTPEAVVIEVPFANGKGTYEYMTATQLMTLDSEGGGQSKRKHYLHVTAKSMQSMNDDLAALVRVSMISLLFFSVLLGLGWLLYRLFSKAKTVKNGEGKAMQGEFS